MPGFFLAWAKRNRIDFPPELEAAVVALGHQVADWKTAFDQVSANYAEPSAAADAERATHREAIERLTQERDGARGEARRVDEALNASRAKKQLLKTRERDTLLKLVIGMAIGGLRVQSERGAERYRLRDSE